MKIIVCAKQIRHTYARTGISPESHFICPEDGVYRVNPHDEAALELALRLKDAVRKHHRHPAHVRADDRPTRDSTVPGHRCRRSVSDQGQRATCLRTEIPSINPTPGSNRISWPGP